MTSCAASERILTHTLRAVAAYGAATGGYVSDVGCATTKARTCLEPTALPPICWVALGRGSEVLLGVTGRDEPRNTSPILDVLTTADAVLLCDLELQRLEDEGKIVIASLDEAG